MICSCHAKIVFSPETFVGTQIYAESAAATPWLVLALVNCASCLSTRAAILYSSIAEDEDEHLEAPIAAE